MKTHMFIIINLLTTLMFFTSCKQDAEESFFFKIETGLLEWHVGAEGGQQEYIVESNAPWTNELDTYITNAGTKKMKVEVKGQEVF